MKLSPVFSGTEQPPEETLDFLKVSDILQGNFAPVEIPMLEIPGSRPLIYNNLEDLQAKINKKDLFAICDTEEEFLMFTAEIEDRALQKQDGPHQTLRWRKKVRSH